VSHKEIAPYIFLLEIPLPETPLKRVNAYLVRGDDRRGGRNLLIDTGFNHAECERAMRLALAALSVDMERTDLFITHMHADHSGLANTIRGEGGRVFAGREDAWLIADAHNPVFWRGLLSFYRFTGLTGYGFSNDVTVHPGYSWAPPAGAAVTEVADGETIRVGDYSLRCIATPGHTRGHMCLYEPERRILFSGDHILGRITPNITLSAPDEDVLAQYFASLDKVSKLDVRIVFPGHRHALDDCRARIGELREHHARRLDEVAGILSGRVLSTVEVTREMRWSLTYRNWEEYPPAQKMFSAGEAFAHLYHLVRTGRAGMREDGGMYVFYPA